MNPQSLDVEKTLLRPEHELAKGLKPSPDVAGRYLAALPGFAQFNSLNPEQSSQGLLACIYELQEILRSWLGFEAVSLAPVSSSQAVFACLAMIRKYYQRKKQRCNSLYYLQGVSDVVKQMAAGMGYDVTLVDIDQIADQDNEGVCALVLPVNLADRTKISEGKIHQLRRKDIIIYIDGMGQSPLSQSSAYAESMADIMHLDLGYFCEVYTGAAAVLANNKLQPHLPTPRVSHSGTFYQWQGHSKNPFSIGPLSSTAGNIEALLECYVQLKLQGVAVLQQNALTNYVYARYLLKELAASGLQQICDDEAFSGVCKFELKSSGQTLKNLWLLTQALHQMQLRIDIRVTEVESSLIVSLRRLHVLEIEQLDNLIKLIIEHLGI